MFGYDRDKDQEATDLLSSLLAEKAISVEQLRRELWDEPVLIFGAGPSLEVDISESSASGLFNICKVIAADDATSALLKAGKLPDVIVTDLDGMVVDQLKAAERGSIIVVHAHGDNTPALRRYVPTLDEAFGTTQVEPRPNVYNFGGFTDGDRAVFLAIKMGASVVALAGMDFGRSIGRYSKAIRPSELKLKKFEIGKKLLEWLASKTDVQLFNMTRAGEQIKGYQRTTADLLARHLGS
jgi:hypothetical protein